MESDKVTMIHNASGYQSSYRRPAEKDVNQAKQKSCPMNHFFQASLMILASSWCTGYLHAAEQKTRHAAEQKQSGAPENSATANRPNILFIITDQHHARMLSAAGNPYLKTRALDSMAKSGIRFSQAYVTNPVCVPSRISIATGMMAGRFGVFHNGMKATIPKHVSDNSLGKLIKAGGYDTFYGGKVHMAPVLSPLKAGYDEYCEDQRDELPDACIEFMTRQRDKPFFAVASFINPHDICYAYNARQPDRKGKPLVNRLYREAQALPADQLPPLPDNSEIPTANRRRSRLT